MNVRQWIIKLAAVALATAGCGAKPQGIKATAEQLEKSFLKSEPAITAEVARASAALQATNFTEAVLIMQRTLPAQVTDAAQKQAVDALILQTRQAIARDPKLNSSELYQAMSDLMVRVHGEN